MRTIFRDNFISESKMTMWADNIKFVKDIIDGKYQKIDSAAAEVIFYWYWLLTFIILFLLFCRWMRMQRLCWRIPPARSQGSIFCQPWEFWNWCRLERLKCSWTQSLGYVYSSFSWESKHSLHSLFICSQCFHMWDVTQFHCFPVPGPAWEGKRFAAKWIQGKNCH